MSIQECPPGFLPSNLDVISIRSEPKAQLEHYAQRRGQDPAAALDEALCAYLEGEREDYDETVHAVLEGYEDVKAGRNKPANELLEGLRVKHAFPR